VTPLLAGLLEVNPQKMWTFERFFSEVTRILAKKKVHFYFVNKLTELRVYLDRNERMADLQLLLMEQADVAPEHQILLFEGAPLVKRVDAASTPGTSFPDTSLDNPITMFGKEGNSVTAAALGELPAFPVLPNLVSVENDATLAKQACAVGYAFKRRVEAHARSADVVGKAVSMLAEVISGQLERLSETADKCRSLARLAEAHSASMDRAHRGQMAAFDVIFPPTAPNSVPAAVDATRANGGRIISDTSQRSRILAQRLAGELSPAVAQLRQRYVAERRLDVEWRDAVRGMPPLAPCAARARAHVTKLKESWQHLLRDRASRTLTYNDEQFHILEKIKMTETVRSLNELLTKEVQPAATGMTEALADWYKMAQTTFLQAEILRKDVDAFEEEAEGFSLAARAASDRYEALLADALRVANEAGPAARPQAAAKGEENGNERHNHCNGNSTRKTSTSSSTSPETQAQIRRALRSILATQDEVWGIMNENNRLIEQFGQLAAASSSSPSGSLTAAGSGDSAAETLAAEVLSQLDDAVDNRWT